MPLEFEERRAIVSYRIEKAERTMIEARDCASLGHWTLAANRLYYSLFYITNAMLVHHGFFAKTHAGMLSLMHDKFVRTEILSREEGKLISRLQNMRQTGDYDDRMDWTEEDVAPYFEQTQEMIDHIKSLILPKNSDN